MEENKIPIIALLIIIIIAIVIGVTVHHHPKSHHLIATHSKTEKKKITCYKVPIRHAAEALSNALDGSDFMLQYLMVDGNNYYSYSSKTPVTNFSSVKWTESKTEPKEIEEQDVQKVGEEEIPEQELSPETQAEIETDVPSEGEATDAGVDASDAGGGGDAGGDGGGGD